MADDRRARSAVRSDPNWFESLVPWYPSIPFALFAAVSLLTVLPLTRGTSSSAREVPGGPTDSQCAGRPSQAASCGISTRSASTGATSRSWPSTGLRR